MIMRQFLLGAALLAPTIAPAAEPPAAARQAAIATKIAGTDLTRPLFLCKPQGGGVVRAALENGSKLWVAPTRAFDNLFYVGNEFVGVWVLKTSAGLILFDSSQSEAEARDHLIPGLEALGLDPKTIRYVIVTHGHWDHFGGAAWLQQTYGARIALGKADWDLIEKAPAGALETNNRPLPRRDIEVFDGQTLTLGDTTITLYVTPGHTPATVSAIVPAKEGGKTYPLSLLGSTAFPPNIEPNERTGGLKLYDQSVLRFQKISAAARTQGILNTHIFADGTLDRLATARARKPGDANPFLTGPDYTKRYYEILHHCLLAAEARPTEDNIWNRPLNGK
jgi:metallo-beta-lactamase class B